MLSCNIITNGGCGDAILAIRFKYLVDNIFGIKTIVFFASRNETWNMIKEIYGQLVLDGEIKQLPEDYLNSVSDASLKSFGDNTYIIYPDKLFRGFAAPPIKKLGITNFSIKQTRTLVGKWKPDNYISLALNSITPGYTYHSIRELALKLCKQFPDKNIYLPLLTTWNNKDLSTVELERCPNNLIIEYNPEFSRVYNILTMSEYCICTDNAIMHICHDLGMPYLTLDPQFNRSAFEARWRPFGYYNSTSINSLVEDIVDTVKTQIDIPETQMIGINDIFRQNKDWSKELIFKE